jgi:hypothetical protein
VGPQAPGVGVVTRPRCYVAAQRCTVVVMENGGAPTAQMLDLLREAAASEDGAIGTKWKGQRDGLVARGLAYWRTIEHPHYGTVRQLTITDAGRAEVER